MKETQILTNEEIQQKTRRMAYQIIEDNYNERELTIIGIKPNGSEYAGRLKKEIEKINGIQISVAEISMNKQNPLDEEICLEPNAKTLNNKNIILVDDVANTGKTLYYAIKPLLNFLPKKVQTVVLVDRQHKLFPITPDFVGLSLSTTLKEHIRVEFEKNGKGAAYLM